MVDFAGWQMPLHYGSQLDEHRIVRNDVGLFDVSHMGVVDVEGAEAESFLRHVLANDVARLKDDGRALYSCMLNPDGGVQDDLIVYRLASQHYRIVVNAATREKDWQWLSTQAEPFDATLTQRPEFAILALQGPRAMSVVQASFPDLVAAKILELKPFRALLHDDLLIGRTGYTGEDGIELILPTDSVVDYWQRFVSAGAKPCGLGARDTLRLEAGMNLYGTDMDEQTSPLESNLAWTVDWSDPERHFIGRDALERQRESGVSRRLVGLVMQEAGMLRNHQPVWLDGDGQGEITSGSFSPTLGHAIALARIPVSDAKAARVERRGKSVPVYLVKPPFVRFGKKVYKEE